MYHRLLIALWISVAVLAILQIVSSNLLVTDGIDLGHMQDEITKLKKDNILLREQIYRASSFEELQQEAAASGFIPAGDPIYILH
jgi:hypothetical protein